MPELPDVEMFKKYLDATALHKTIAQVDVKSEQILEGISVQILKNELLGKRFEMTHRHGKYLFLSFNEAKWLGFHFGMTGFLKYFKKMEKAPPHDRLLIGFSNGYYLAYDSQRKLGKVLVIPDVEEFR